MAEKYILKVTAGPSYDPSTHFTVPVNSPDSTHISSSRCSVDLCVRVQNYRGLPRNSPSTSPYFSHPTHTKDQYSISFHLHLPADKPSIPGTDLVFGNDFDKPVRDRLPPGFGTAFRIVKWGIDPGLDGDMYADKPYLYGNALSSFNVIRVGSKKDGENDEIRRRQDEVILEGPSQSSTNDDDDDEDNATKTNNKNENNDTDEQEPSQWRLDRSIPPTASDRKKYLLTPAHQSHWEWEAGRTYSFDFFNPYLDFNNFALKLPGFSLSLLGYLGGTDFLRYVLRDKNSEKGECLFVVVFSLLKVEDGEREEKEEEDEAKKLKGKKMEEEKHREQGAAPDGKKEDGTEGREHAEGEGGGGARPVQGKEAGEETFEPKDDDLD